MITTQNTARGHLIAASNIVHATAFQTVKETKDAIRTIPHIDAVFPFLTAADFYYSVAELLAEGAPLDCDMLAMELKFAERKAAEGRNWLKKRR